MPSLLYNQGQAAATLNGYPIVAPGRGDGGEGEGVIKIEWVGGEATRTEGINGAGMNISAEQGGNIHITLQERSPAIGYIMQCKRQQMLDGVLATVVVFTGTQTVVTLTGAIISTPGELGTGGKKQGQQVFSFMGPSIVRSD